MNAPSDVRSQLGTLRISREQRPGKSAPTLARRIVRSVVLVLILGSLATAAYFGRERISEAFQAATTSDTSSASGSSSSAGASSRSNAGSGSPSGGPRLFTVTQTREPDPSPVLTATGKIVSDHQVEVATKVSGQIVALHFEQGDRVKKGQTLARIEDVIYRARRDETAARLQRSKATLEYQKINFQRVSSLREGASAPPIEFADAQRWLHEAEASVAADQAALSFTQKALDDTEIVAPIDGVVLTRNVEVGDFVAAEGGRGAMANAQFAVVADMAKLRVEVDISELDIARLRTNMPCVVVPDAYKDRKYPGFVMWIDPGANYSKATVQVKVRIENPDDNLRVEGSAQVAFLSEPPKTNEDRTTGLWIPESACLTGGSKEGTRVMIVADGRWRERAIQTGRRGTGQIEVLSGLAEGDRIAVEGVDKLREGHSAVR